jgi:hypothetical protein
MTPVTMSSFVLPRVGQRVRVRDDHGRFDLLATVTGAGGEYVVLDLPVAAVKGHVIYSSPDGPVQLTGSIVDRDEECELWIAGQQRMQRRAAWRVRVDAPTTVTRADGSAVECRVMDVSMTGVLLDGAAAELEPDERVVVRIHEPDLDVELTGTVIRRDHNLRAIALDPLSRRADTLLHRAVHQRQQIR